MVLINTRGDASGDYSLNLSPFRLNHHWAHDFVARHEDVLDIRARRKLDDERTNVSLEGLRLYYVQLGLLKARHRYPEWAIANMDETSLKVTSKGRRAVVMRGMKFGFAKGDKAVGHITLAVTIFADGSAVKPLSILDMKYLPKELSNRVVGHFAFSGQDNGWMTAEIFKFWARDVFVPEIENRRLIHRAPGQRVLLLVDGHASRANSEALEYLQAHNIDVVTPVAHSSHVCQPLDLRFLAVFKSQLSGMRWRLMNSMRAQQRNTILEMAIDGLYAACRDDIVRASWKLSGIAPFDPQLVLEERLVTEGIPTDPVTLEQRTKPKRGPCINEQILTSPESIAQVRAKNQAAAAKKAAKSDKKKVSAMPRAPRKPPKRARTTKPAQKSSPKRKKN